MKPVTETTTTTPAAERSPMPLPTVLKATVNTLKQCQFEINLLPPKQKSTRQTCLVMIESTLGMIDRCDAVNEREELFRVIRQMNRVGSPDGGYCVCPLQDGSAPNNKHASRCVDARAVLDFG